MMRVISNVLFSGARNVIEVRKICVIAVMFFWGIVLFIRVRIPQKIRRAVAGWYRGLVSWKPILSPIVVVR